MTIRVLLVDDQDLVRAGFALVLDSQPDLAVVGEAADGAAAVRLARERPADVMVMDVRMPGLDAIRSVHNGESVVAPSTTRRLIGRFLPHLPVTGEPPPGLTELTARERQVLAEVGSGLSNAEIAALLHISEATVKTHVGHIMTKLCLRDRIQAVVYAYETGLVTPQGRAIGPTPR